MVSISSFLALSLIFFTLTATTVVSIPKTPKRPVVDEYHGVKVTEDYRWLENISDPEVRAWSEAQNRYTRAYLDHLPGVADIRKRLLALDVRSTSWFDLRYRGGKLFALKYQPPKQQSFLLTLRSADEPGSEQVVVDPNKFDPRGSTAIDFYVPSRDGKQVAVCLSEGGSEKGSVQVFEVATGKRLSDVVPRVNYGTAGGSLAWNAEGTGFYYTRYPLEGERPAEDLHFYQQVYFHKMGTPESQDTYIIGKEFPKIAEIVLSASENGRYLLASVANGDGGEYAFYLMASDGQWIQLTKFEDKIVQAQFGLDEALYMLSRENASRGKVLRLPLSTPSLAQAKVLVPESEAVLQGFEPTASRIYVDDLLGGTSRVRVFDLLGLQQKEVPILPVSSVWGIVRTTGDEVLFNNVSYVDPPAWYRYSPATDTAVKTALFRTSPADFSDAEVVREWATSKDGTRVPMSVIRRKGTKRDGTNPTLLTGYGGYGISQTPSFEAFRRVWLDQGGVLAIANIRGGGEFGEDWHKAGNLTRKQNVFDDFTACAQHLIDTGYTRRDKLAIEGGSNGGLLMGAVLTQHPDLFKCVISHAGIYDMLRVELHPNGAFNVTEFGTVKDPEQFKALYAYSPYHHVVDSTSYPATLFLTGANDPRVDPANSRKMVARLQAATASKAPILLRTNSKTGHGIGSPRTERIAADVDVYAFLFHELGVDFKPVAAPRFSPAKKNR